MENHQPNDTIKENLIFHIVTKINKTTGSKVKMIWITKIVPEDGVNKVLLSPLAFNWFIFLDVPVHIGL